MTSAILGNSNSSLSSNDADLGKSPPDSPRSGSVTPTARTVADIAGGEPIPPIATPSDGPEPWMAPINFLAELSLEDERERITAVLKRWPNPKAASRDQEARVTFERVLPPPSEDMENSHLPYFFGWAVTREWLRVFAQCAIGPDPTDHYGGHGMMVLRKVAGAARAETGKGLALIYELVVHDSAPFVRGSAVSPERAHIVRMVSIRNTAFLDYLYYRLPTVAQYAWLCAVMPGAPQWYRGVMGNAEYVKSLEYCDTYVQNKWPA